MRDIKFRAWQKDKEAMCDVNSIYFKGTQATLIEKPNVFNTREFKSIVLMQYTGLNDKNGKEIYEGDLVQVANYNWEGLYKVVWNKDNSMYMIADANGDLEKLCEFEYIVRGNIYENPEFIRGQA